MNLTRNTALTPLLASAPAWFRAAIAQPTTSHYLDVEGCSIYYLLWSDDPAGADRPGLLFVHGGAAHAHWWRFIAPFFTDAFRVAAIDLSGMGDSGHRDAYADAQRTREIRAVLSHAELGSQPFVVGHSFGGYMMMRFGATYGAEIGGVVIVDSPVRHPDMQGDIPPPHGMRRAPRYASLEAGLSRFRLLPAQPCENDFIVDFIGRQSLVASDRGWRWKFDVSTMTLVRYEYRFHDDLQQLLCRAALIYGQNSALVSRETAVYMSQLMGPSAPVVAIPEAYHHVMLDQPLAFVAALRTLLDNWTRAGAESTLDAAPDAGLKPALTTS